MRVAIVGGPGIGKSTLVRQLGDLYHQGSYGEGEKGVWDPRVLEDIEEGRNPVGVTAYFAALYDADTVTREFWRPVIDALAQPRHVAPLCRAEVTA